MANLIFPSKHAISIRHDLHGVIGGIKLPKIYVRAVSGKPKNIPLGVQAILANSNIL
jgi:hypothetical protein